MSFIDWFLLALLGAVMPIMGYINFNKLVKEVEAGEPVMRLSLYNQTIAGLWIMCAVVLTAWIGADRPLAELGIRLPDLPGFWVSALIGAGLIAYALYYRRKFRHMGVEEALHWRQKLKRVEMLMPRNGHELARFDLVSLTAGITEEVIWRGYIIWCLAQVMPLWLAAAISAVGFAAAHAYQGAGGATRVLVISASLTAMYVVSNSLLLPMIIHAVFDMMQGRSAYELIRNSDLPDTTTRESDCPA